jgi:hypothetical protein
METILTNVWNVAHLGEMSEPSIRKLHQPPEWHRISRHVYPVGTSFPGAMKSGTCYVLGGKCRYTFGTEAVVLSAGTWAVLPGGDYTFQVLGDHAAEIAFAWRLPFAVPPPKREAT